MDILKAQVNSVEDAAADRLQQPGDIVEDEKTHITNDMATDGGLEAKRAIRKTDHRLLPVLAVLYVLAFLDRGNLGNAKVAGMNSDLGLSSAQYTVALTVFFFPYAFFEVPSNMMLKVLRPSVWICIMVAAWGVVMTLQGLVKQYNHLIVTRFFLGVCESGFFPAASYLLTTWYCRFEVQTRIAIFFSAASLAGAFSGLLAFAIEQMDGVAGLEGWRWIFILEAMATVAVAVPLPWLLPDSPATAGFLTASEKDAIIGRLAREAGMVEGAQGVNSEGFSWGFFRDALTEWKLYAAVVTYWASSIPIYAFTYSAPSIVNQLGYSASDAQLMTVPIYVLGVISTLTFSILSDRSGIRWIYIIVPYAIAASGFIGLLAIPHPALPGLTYGLLFAIPAGCYPPMAGIMAWGGNNLAPSWKRAIGMALITSFGNLGGAIGSNIFTEDQKPQYPIGYGVSLATIVAGIGAAVVLKTVWSRANASRDRMDQDEIRGRYTQDELVALGDQSPLFRYVI